MMVAPHATVSATTSVGDATRDEGPVASRSGWQEIDAPAKQKADATVTTRMTNLVRVTAKGERGLPAWVAGSTFGSILGSGSPLGLAQV
jgi:hypothetical protein